MKKTEIKFLCDDCGKALPEKYISKNGNGDVFYDGYKYNTVVFPLTIDADLRIAIDVNVSYDYGPTYKDLCPECRVKWLEKALKKFKEAAKDGSKTD